ncbi:MULTISPECIES: ABC transporter ATP-binding protein [unclassified Bacillus (in: firmicutes)]|uniref:ABC transporter ATP-binding protein n=1 Tax=unclassified Bacillus (in: firmicutes) TaxID=185979 RepID=UPI0008EFF337|nr:MULTISPECIES: ABC transporter ATP-binding protein [unclassified Bacillus (in: firmicutes)]SFB07839.1 ATP-binding cassette, subfamily B [Bacillus sp. UNCCL13]SFQ87205.1 ATP-binding cassette, subfamily B [Bacillus sp. cl95]
MFKELSKPFRYKRTYPNVNPVLPAQKAKAKNWKNTLRRLWRYLAEHKLKLYLVLFMVIASSVFGLLGPYLIGKAVDDYIVTKDNQGIVTLIIWLALVYLFQSLAIFLQNYWMITVSQKTVFTLRTDLFHQLHHLPISYFDQRQHGEVMSRVTNDIENISTTLNSSFIQIISSLLTLIGTLGVMLWLSPILTFLTIMIVPLMFFGLKWITKRTGVLFKEQQKNLGEMNGFIEETISGQKVVKMFSQEDQVIADFREKNEKLRDSGFWAQAFSGFIPKLMNVLNNASFAVIAGVGGLLALKGIITVGVIIVFTEYSRQFTRPLNDLANQFNTLLSAVAGAERVFEVLDEEKELDEGESDLKMNEVKGKVEFRDVSFSYEKGGDTVSNISFTALPGEMVALVGPTGAGKSTIMNLLSRFYDATQGAIFIDGHDITKVKRASLRRHMAFVLQDSFLFEGTIRENIRYGRLAATDLEIEEAAKKANAHSFITKTKDGYDTVLKQDGSGISQGQKQLLSIARAILANPAILILDEATSSIDTVTELKIQEALQVLMEGRTSFVIAHRLNTIQKADQIIVLEQGQIIERGNHEELLDRKGFYYQLASSGNRGLG